MRAKRSASFTIRSASGRVTAGSSSAARVSASTSSAPIGVLSSWLTLATKSRRTLSIRCTSDTSATNAATPSGRSIVPIGTAHRCTTARGGPNNCSSRSHRSPCNARETSVSSAPATTRIGVARLAIALGRGVAEDLDAIGIEHDDALTELVECGEELVAPLLGTLGLLEGGCHRVLQRRLVAPLRTHDLAEPPRDVTLGAGIGRER